MIIHIVRFTSALADERIRDLFSARAQQYMPVPGLLQKYYLRYQNGQHGGVYVWDSPESMQAFRGSELSRSIHDVYRVRESALDVADVILALRPEPALTGTACASARPSA
jgi:heme-degrading monooxygenase HmoA